MTAAAERPRVLFDTNVLIDFLLDRAPFANAAADLLSRADRGQIQGFACANSFTTIFYLARKAAGNANAKAYVASLLSILEVAPVSRATLEGASSSDMTDFEDAVVAESGKHVDADFIVTRDERDFVKSPIAAHSPKTLLGILQFM